MDRIIPRTYDMIASHQLHRSPLRNPYPIARENTPRIISAAPKSPARPARRGADVERVLRTFAKRVPDVMIASPARIEIAPPIRLSVPRIVTPNGLGRPVRPWFCFFGLSI